MQRNGVIKSDRDRVNVPSAHACKLNLHGDKSSTISKGNAINRSLCRQIREIKDDDSGHCAISMMQSFEFDDSNANEIHP
jgi:hypothetical protein